ncbi:uncharacterized protein VTP21DRAFT_7951 [Calcarisporiella thermophila]|uniref:uncharacterized protein n=1 Tax=Calcarisporiella thermophila TaxID=911321 RepID=UPI003742012A
MGGLEVFFAAWGFDAVRKRQRSPVGVAIKHKQRPEKKRRESGSRQKGKGPANGRGAGQGAQRLSAWPCGRGQWRRGLRAAAPISSSGARKGGAGMRGPLLVGDPLRAWSQSAARGLAKRAHKAAPCASPMQYRRVCHGLLHKPAGKGRDLRQGRAIKLHPPSPPRRLSAWRQTHSEVWGLSPPLPPRARAAGPAGPLRARTGWCRTRAVERHGAGPGGARRSRPLSHPEARSGQWRAAPGPRRSVVFIAASPQRCSSRLPLLFTTTPAPPTPTHSHAPSPRVSADSQELPAGRGACRTWMFMSAAVIAHLH